MDATRPDRLTREQFARLLNEARQTHHLSIRAAARVADVPAATVQGWLNGKHFPTPALRPRYLRLVAAVGLLDQLPAALWADSAGGSVAADLPGLAAAALTEPPAEDEQP